VKIVLLHGLGQSAQDWNAVLAQLPDGPIDCPELFSLLEAETTYPNLLQGLEQRYAEESEPLLLCGLSLGAVLALDFAIRHGEQVAGLVLMAPRYHVSSWLVDFQNLIFRGMPERAFQGMGLSKKDAIALTRSMRKLDLRDGLDRVTCPVTILCGKKDKANREAAETLAERLPQAALRLVPGAGHELNKEAPKEVAAVLREMKNRLES